MNPPITPAARAEGQSGPLVTPADASAPKFSVADGSGVSASSRPAVPHPGPAPAPARFADPDDGGDADFAPASDQERVSLCETLDRVLNKGVVICGELTISVADIDLIYLGVNVLLTSIENAKRMIPPRLHDVARDPANSPIIRETSS